MVTDAASKGAMIVHTGIEYISLDMRKRKRLNNLPSSPFMSAKTLFGLKHHIVAYAIKCVMLKIVENKNSFCIWYKQNTNAIRWTKYT